MKAEYTEAASLVGNAVLPRASLSVIGGPPKAGKSLLVSNLSLCLASGAPWCGFPTVQSRVLVVQAEVPERQLQDRYGKMMRAREMEASAAIGLVTIRGLALDQPPGIRMCREYVEQWEPDLLIIDPLARFFTG